MTMRTTMASHITKVAFFHEGPGFIFMGTLNVSHRTRVMLVKSMKDGALYVRKEIRPTIFSKGQHIEYEEVRFMRQLGDLKSVPELLGWVDYCEKKHGKAFAVLYTKLMNARTIFDLKQRLRSRQRGEFGMSAECMWSVYSQMISVFLHAVKKDILHDDAHDNNWFVHVEEGCNPQVMLGDWEMCLEAPPHEPQCKVPECTPACPRTRWWDECYRELNQIIGCLVQWLFELNSQTDADKFDNSQKSQPFHDLLQHLGELDRTHPSNFTSGEAWLVEIEKINSSATRKKEEQRQSRFKESNNGTLHDHCQLSANYTTKIPSYDLALHELQWLEFRGDTPRFWRTAYYDEDAQMIVGLEGTHQRLEYVDSTSFESLPARWLIDHRSTTETMHTLDILSKKAEDKGKREPMAANGGCYEDKEMEGASDEAQMIEGVKRLGIEKKQ